MKKPIRIPWIDELRGLAILLMIPANLSALWSAPHPLWFRIIASYAAPTFIMLSAGMVSLNADRHPLQYFIERGLLIIGFGALIDVFIFKISPFITYDVLYLIGFAMPFIYLLRNFSALKLIALASFFLILTPPLQSCFGYHLEISELTWSHLYWPGTVRLLEAWLLDGWFPVFPWFGIATLGLLFFRVIFSTKDYLISNKMLFVACLLFLVGFFVLFFPTTAWNNMTNHSILTERQGYSEIFYPPTLGYLITAMGAFIMLARLAQFLSKLPISKKISLFGRFSLLVYILHQAIGTYILTPLLKIDHEAAFTKGLTFSGVVLLTILVIYFICLGLQRLKQGYSPSWMIFQILIGK